MTMPGRERDLTQEPEDLEASTPGPPPASGGPWFQVALLVLVSMGLGVGYSLEDEPTASVHPTGAATRPGPAPTAAATQAASRAPPPTPEGPAGVRPEDPAPGDAGGTDAPGGAPPPSATASAGTTRAAAPPLPEPDPTPPPVTGPANPSFPAEQLVRLERVLATIEKYALAPDDTVLPAAEAPPEATSLASKDPREYARRMRVLPGTRHFLTWMAGGARPELARPALRVRLGKIDARLRELGWMPFFAPYLEARPAAPLDQAAGTWGSLPVPARRFEGWAAAAARDLRRLLASLPAKLEELEDRKAELLGEIPEEHRELRGTALVAARMEDPAARRRVATWLRPEAHLLRRGIYAAGRAMAEAPAEREELALLFGRALEDAALVFHGEVAGLDPEQWMGGEPGSPAAWCLAGEAVSEAIWAEDAMGGLAPARTAAQPELWAEAMATDPETKGTPAAGRRFRRALWRLVEFYVRSNAAGAVKKLIFHYRQPMRDDPAQLGGAALLELGTYLAARPAFPKTLGPAEEGFTALAIRRLLASGAKLPRRAQLEKVHKDLKALIRRPESG